VARATVIAVQLYTIRSLLDDPARLAGVLARLREIGYEAVEVAGLGPRVVDRFGDELRRSGMKACAVHAGLDHLNTELDRVIDECHEWGCEFVVVPSLPPSYRSGEGFRRFAAEASELAGRLREQGLRLAYHNHAFELERYDGETGLETIFGSARPDALEAELDTYWLQFGGANPASWIRRFKHRVPLVHLKDMAISGGDPVDAEIGEGNLEWAEILRACRDAGTRWLVVEQDDPRREPLEAVAISHRNLVRLMSSVEAGR
jgi:sugar phosphate isomerase/epimerase